MKKMVLLAMTAVAGTFLMTGCVTRNDNNVAKDFAAVMVPAKFETIVEHQNTKVTGEAQLNVLFKIFSWGVSDFSDRAFLPEAASVVISSGPFHFVSPETLVKAAATFDACAKAKADLLLNAKYKITATDYFVFQKINCKVEGYPAIEKGIKPVK